MSKRTEPQARLLSRLPEMFYIREDFRRSNCPPTEVVSIETGNVIFAFGRGEFRSFQSLCERGDIEHAEAREEAEPQVFTRLYAKS